jgi:hypothetical protein
MNNTNQKKASVLVVFITVSLLISGSMSVDQGLAYGSKDNKTDASTQKNTLPQLSINWGNTKEQSQLLKIRQVSYVSSSGSTIKNPDFSFTVLDWPSVRYGDIITPVFKNSLDSAKPSDVRIQFVNVLNPHQARDFQSIVLGSNIISLPFGTNDNGKYRYFLVSNDIYHQDIIS